jgi:hypothetical protein
MKPISDTSQLRSGCVFQELKHEVEWCGISGILDGSQNCLDAVVPRGFVEGSLATAFRLLEFFYSTEVLSVYNRCD